MEPLDVVTADWIKDYDPLFDLFDAELGSGAMTGAPPATWQGTAATWQGACCGTSGGADFFAPMTAGASDYGDLNQYYPTSCKHPIDELSIILGLDWMPSMSDVSSPTETSTAYSSSAPSPATSSSCGSAGQNANAQNGMISSNINSNKSNSAVSTKATIKDICGHTAKKPQHSHNSNIKVGYSKTYHHSDHDKYASCRSKLVAKLNTNNHNKITSDFDIKLNCRDRTQATTATHLVSTNNDDQNSVLSPSSRATWKKKSKKCVRAKGTSLLAHPSPKSISLSAATTVSATSSTATPTKTIVTVSKAPETKPTFFANSIPLKCSSPLSSTISNTIIASINTNQNLLCQSRDIAITAANQTALIPTATAMRARKLLALHRTTKLCARIEHDYAAVRPT